MNSVFSYILDNISFQFFAWVIGLISGVIGIYEFYLSRTNIIFNEIESKGVCIDCGKVISVNSSYCIHCGSLNPFNQEKILNLVKNIIENKLCSANAYLHSSAAEYIKNSKWSFIIGVLLMILASQIIKNFDYLIIRIIVGIIGLFGIIATLSPLFASYNFSKETKYYIGIYQFTPFKLRELKSTRLLLNSISDKEKVNLIIAEYKEKINKINNLTKSDFSITHVLILILFCFSIYQIIIDFPSKIDMSNYYAKYSISQLIGKSSIFEKCGAWCNPSLYMDHPKIIFFPVILVYIFFLLIDYISFYLIYLRFINFNIMKVINLSTKKY